MGSLIKQFQSVINGIIWLNYNLLITYDEKLHETMNYLDFSTDFYEVGLLIMNEF